MAIVDREATYFEVVHMPTFAPVPEDAALAAQFFASLRVYDLQSNLMGETRTR